MVPYFTKNMTSLNPFSPIDVFRRQKTFLCFLAILEVLEPRNQVQDVRDIATDVFLKGGWQIGRPCGKTCKGVIKIPPTHPFFGNIFGRAWFWLSLKRFQVGVALPCGEIGS